MRALPILLIAAVFATLATAEPHSEAAHHAVKHLHDHVRNLPQAYTFPIPKATPGARLFGAQQSSTCDPNGFADATARVVQACPSLSGLVTGTTTPIEFLPTFCGSECHKVLAAELVKFPGCIDTTTAFLLGFIEMCKTRPHCYTKPVVQAQTDFQTSCTASINLITNVTSFSTADAAKAACAGTCITQQEDLFKKYPECMTDGAGVPLQGAALIATVKFFCTKPANDEYCTVSLRNLGKFDCKQTNACASNTAYWCATTTSTGACDPAPTTARLTSLCTSCLDGLIAISTATATGKARDSVQLAQSKEYFCMRVTPSSATSDFCLPSVGTAFATVYAGLSTIYTNSAMATTCATDGGKCLARYLALAGSLAELNANVVFDACVVKANSASSACVSSFESSLRQAALLKALAPISCGTNPAGNQCFVQYQTMFTSTCYQACRFTSNSSCNTEMDALVTSAGCCLPMMNELAFVVFNQASNAYPGQLFPAGSRTSGTKSFTFSSTTVASATAPTLENKPIYGVVRCTTTPTATATVSATTAECAARQSTAATKTLPLVLAWARVSAQPDWFKARLLNAFRLDISAQLGLAPNLILGLALAENTADTVVLRAASRRQAAGTLVSSTKLTFKLDGTTATEAATASALFDAKVAAFAFYTPTAGGEVDGGCPSCVDARASSISRGNAYMTSLPPVTYTTVAAPGSASAISIAFAAIIAMVVVML